jgi:hypothetical protein
MGPYWAMRSEVAAFEFGTELKRTDTDVTGTTPLDRALGTNSAYLTWSYEIPDDLTDQELLDLIRRHTITAAGTLVETTEGTDNSDGTMPSRNYTIEIPRGYVTVRVFLTHPRQLTVEATD